MTPAEATRPVLIAAVASLALMTAGCGSQDQGQGRFEALADHVAAIDVPLKPNGSARAPSAERGLRPAAFSPVKVAVMDPHDMWDARDAQTGLRVIATRAVEPVVEATSAPTLRPEADRAPSEPSGQTPPANPIRVIQLGAYASETAARAAWARRGGDPAMAGLSPRFETVSVGERTLTRLKVEVAPGRSAAEVCRAAGVNDPWCRRAG
ncbi:SPOR domain-containing protein [Brevundimonas sp. UBA7534]|uniref:SPOR domain-containing protein n=1 Tax=Brevundimonas sp. UBA7534 TaxID=1946138 RepID=UPI0025C4F7A7|nr:SPOR domain-containing protein [Brevundimonas sp. UBA7534]